MAIKVSNTTVIDNSRQLTNVKEKTYTLTGTALNPSNGTVQYKAISANTTLTDSFEAGSSMFLILESSGAYTVTWPTATWLNNGGTAPAMGASGIVAVSLFKFGSTLYAMVAGDQS